MFDRDGCFIQYNTEAEMLAVLKGDRLSPNLSPICQQHMVVDAASWGWVEAIQYMVDEMEFSADDPDGKNYTPLGYAAMKGHFQTVKMLVEEYDVEVNARNNEGPHFGGAGWFDGYTALDYALQHKHYHIVRFLLDNGAEVDDEAGETVDDILERANAELKKQAQQQWAKFKKKAMRAWTIISFWMKEVGESQYAPTTAGGKRYIAELEHLGKQVPELTVVEAFGELGVLSNTKGKRPRSTKCHKAAPQTFDCGTCGCCVIECVNCGELICMGCDDDAGCYA